MKKTVCRKGWLFAIAILLSLSTTLSAVAIEPPTRSAPAPDNRALVVVAPANAAAFRATTAAVKAAGGQVRHAFPPAALIGTVPEGTALPPTARVYRTPAPTGPSTNQDASTASAIAVWNRSLAHKDVTAPGPGNPSPETVAHDVILPRDTASATAAPDSERTSAFLIGRVAVAVVLPESSGATDPSTEDWTPAEEDQALAGVADGLDWWAQREPRANLQFVYEVHRGVPTGYEPIARSSLDHTLWGSEAMQALGASVAADSFYGDMRAYAHALRQRLDTDWALVVFVADSAADADGSFSDGRSAFCYLGGPVIVLTTKNGSYGPARLGMVAAHEVGHIFWAYDQYATAGFPCTTRSGYLQVENQNSECGSCTLNEPSIMKFPLAAYDSGLVDFYARGQVGWMDSDGDDLLDPVDTSPAAALDTKPANPTMDTAVTYAGTARDVPWDCPDPAWPDATINTITGVSYRVNGGDWQAAAPADGTFDSAAETFTWTMTGLPTGIYKIDLRVSNSAGNQTVYEASDTLYVLDPADGGLDTILTSPEPVGPSAFAYAGVAFAPVGARVSRAEYRVDGGAWQEAIPADGAFDSAVEEFRFTTGDLAPGKHRIEARTHDDAGRVEAHVAVDMPEIAQGGYTVFLPLIIGPAK